MCGNGAKTAVLCEARCGVLMGVGSEFGGAMIGWMPGLAAVGLLRTGDTLSTRPERGARLRGRHV